MSGDYSLGGLAVPESLDLLHDLLQGAGAQHPEIAAADLMLFETAVIEIAGNVVEHGRPVGRVQWDFRLRVLPDRLEARLSDGGEAYQGSVWSDMPDAMAEDGRGFALAKMALDELTYERADQANHWTMVRRRR